MIDERTVKGMIRSNLPSITEDRINSMTEEFIQDVNPFVYSYLRQLVTRERERMRPPTYEANYRTC